MKHFVVTGIAFLILLSFVSSVQALKQPEQYEYGQCELIAKDYQKAFYGDMIFVQPVNAYSSCDFNSLGHWVNKAYTKERGSYYVDYKSSTYFKNIDEIKDWYEMLTDKQSEIYNVNQGGDAPFGIIYRY